MPWRSPPPTRPPPHHPQALAPISAHTGSSHQKAITAARVKAEAAAWFELLRQPLLTGNVPLARAVELWGCSAESLAQELAVTSQFSRRRLSSLRFAEGSSVYMMSGARTSSNLTGNLGREMGWTPKASGGGARWGWGASEVASGSTAVPSRDAPAQSDGSSTGGHDSGSRAFGSFASQDVASAQVGLSREDVMVKLRQLETDGISHRDFHRLVMSDRDGFERCKATTLGPLRSLVSNVLIANVV